MVPRPCGRGALHFSSLAIACYGVPRMRPLAWYTLACHVDGVIEFEADVPRWKQVAEVIRQRIADGTYPPRTRVPSVVQLATEFGIAQATAQKVHRGLRDEGLIYTEPGLGSFVTASPQPPGS